MRITTFLVFETLQTAEQEAAQIAANMGLDAPEKWADPQPRNDGKWGFKKPADLYMTAVEDYVEEEYDPIIYHITGESDGQ